MEHFRIHLHHVPYGEGPNAVQVREVRGKHKKNGEAATLILRGNRPISGVLAPPAWASYA
jgi:hypothetical protein